ncbi:fatty acid synthase-like isoform X2 [Cydia pomonella]|uniref:fatty acid synthase-like isoform X2 n=1 Tax=Cydia pomonella TaxID=82600 RepID=UPI002ADE34B6|nr:fatty acid synthase-like isoform X2 [Cydia pomonella]
MDRNNNDSEVVLTGLSGRLPESSNIEEFAQQLFDGVDLVTADDRRWTPDLYGLPERSGKLKDLKHFDAGFFRVHAKQAHVMDVQLRLLMEVVHEAIVDAGLNPTELRGSRTGVYVGVSNSETEEVWYANTDNVTGYTVTGCARSMFANRISYTFDLNGPSLAIDTACSSSMFALAHAFDAIRNGSCDAAVVAGTHVCLKPSTVNFKKLNMLSPEGRCAAFDASGRGYVRSEAVVAVLLQRSRDARRVYCTVRGAGMNNDGFKTKGITYPSGVMQGRLAQETFEKANLRPQDVVYVEAHGTGTKAGDPQELNAIAGLFCKDRQTPLLIGAVKSNMGHAEPASGLCSVIKVVLAMERGLIPGNLHYQNPNEKIPALRDGRLKVVQENTPWKGGLVAVNSFGFGGANATVILEGGRGERLRPAEYPIPRLVLASGRTDEATERLIRLAAAHQRDTELHALFDAVHARAIPGHPYRGFGVLDTEHNVEPIIKVLKSENEARPVWLVFSGVGSQWSGAARELMRLPTFASSIARSSAALKPHGVDLQYVITDAPDTIFDNIINTFVSITAIQVALVDVLRELGVHPDGIIGSSCGEIGCAYADEALTVEQAALCAYWRGFSLLDARLAPGAMAAIGMSWEEAQRLCPPDVECACYNTANDILVSGPPASIEKFMAELSAEGVFTRRIKSSKMAFHSKYIAPAAPILHANLLKVIPEPKSRSERWLSTSVPQEQWNSDLAKLSDATYHVNNFTSPVRFAMALAHVPENALVVELAPHAQMQAVLRSTLPDAVHIPLLHREAPDALVHLLTGVGKIYAAGLQPEVARLYPAVSWPVSCGTPSLASHIGWDHSVEWTVADCKTAASSGQNVVEYNLNNPEDAFFFGYNIDGRTLFPATGYLTLMWMTMAKMQKVKIEEAAVVIENMQLRRATVISRDAPIRFLVTVFSGSGEFEICEGGDVVVSGSIRLINDPASERLPSTTLDTDEQKEDLPSLTSAEVYKILHLRGYNYEGLFCGIQSSNARATCGMINWVENWISFMDTMLQFDCLGQECCGLYLPTFIQSVVIDPMAQRAAATVFNGGPLPVKVLRDIDIVVAGGVELRGVKYSLSPRRVNVALTPDLDKYVFIPFERVCADTEERYAAATLHLALENCIVHKLKVAELALNRPAEALVLPYAKKVLEAEPRVLVDGTVVAGAAAAQYSEAMASQGVQVSNQEVESEGFRTDWHVILATDLLTYRPGSLTAAASAASFIVLDEPALASDQPAVQSMLEKTGLTLISRARTTSREYLLLRRVAAVPATKIVIEARDDDFAWVDNLKDAMKRAEHENLRVYLWSSEQGSGLLGLGTSLKLESGGDRLRVFYLPGGEAFDPAAPMYCAQVQLDLTVNVLRVGVWGTFRHQSLGDVNEALLQVEHAYVITLTRGDLSSLRWIESDLRYASVTSRPNTDLCRVYYAPLNFRDVMIATGKLPPDALPRDLAEQECILGLEFSGVSSTGKRVMALVPAKGLATTVLADKSFMWEIPKRWTLEEAATVPVAYATAYYALVVRGRMRRGETVLVHAGAGDVGQAAIAIALHAGCTVFTTVGTPDNRGFLLERFPQLLDANVGQSRNCSFEQLVRLRTHGRGVDVVLNSLAGDKLQASLRCLAEGGRFLEIGKVDLSANMPFGMSVLLKNITVHGILLDALLDERCDHPDKAEVSNCITEGIATGAVRPLHATVYSYNQLEQAFRLMATGEHIGKVLIRVREKVDGDLALVQLIPALPKTYMHPEKSYVLVGGLGGIGLVLGEWLVGRGARTLVFSSRRGVRTGYQARCIRRCREAGVRVVVSTADACTAQGSRALLLEAASAAPIGGIFNLAAVLHDALLERQTPEHFQAIARPKINATRELDAASRELAPELEYFVAFSSVSAGRGAYGMNAYGFANSAMERLCEQRQADGFPALAVQWGAIGDVGMIVDIIGYRDIEIGGMRTQTISSVLETLGVFLSLPHAVTASTVVGDKGRATDQSLEHLLQAVADILGITDLDKVNETATLAELGMDSLMNTEIKQVLERGHDVFLSAREVRALTFRAMRDLGVSASR